MINLAREGAEDSVVQGVHGQIEESELPAKTKADREDIGMRCWIRVQRPSIYLRPDYVA